MDMGMKMGMDMHGGLMIFFGWMTLINFGFLLLGSLMLLVMRNFIMNIHSKWFGIDKKNLPGLYFAYLGQYKLLVIVFNLVPFLVFWMYS